VDISSRSFQKCLNFVFNRFAFEASCKRLPQIILRLVYATWLGLVQSMHVQFFKDFHRSAMSIFHVLGESFKR
jgi:hypothetical protein